MITLTQLEYIVAVEKHQNFGLAAKSCHISQPTLSMQIQKLEDHLGVVIFDRSAQPIQPTPLGQRILEQSRIVLSESAKITELIHEEKERIEGDLHLAVIPTLAPYVLPLFLKAFGAQYPGIRLRVEERRTEDILAGLKKNQIDVGLLVTPLDEPLIRELPLFQEPFYVYAAAQSPLAQQREISERDLAGEHLLLLSEGHCMREQTLRVCKGRAQRSSNLQFESGSIETLCHLVEKGHGYTMIPHLAKEWLQGRSGRIVPFSAPSPSREVSLVVHQSFIRNSVLAALDACIRESLPPELGLNTGQRIPIH